MLQTYASLLGIIGMFLVFLKQYKDSRIRDLETRLRIKADSLIDFINREIAPAYDNQPSIIADTHDYDTTVRAIEDYRSERKKDIPSLDTDNVRRLLVLWAIADRDKDTFVQLKNEFDLFEKKPVLPTCSMMFFVSYFTVELLLGFVGILFVMVEHEYQYLTSMVIVGLAIIGLLPLANLLYRIR